MNTRFPRQTAASLFCLCVTLATSQAADPAANWPSWRGPLGMGISTTAVPPLTWSDTNNIKWKAAIPGRGSSTPIIWENKVFVQTAVPTGKKVEADTNQPTAAAQPGLGGMSTSKPDEIYRFVVLCLDRQSGKKLWEETVREVVPHEGHHKTDGTFASSSPVTDGQNIFAYFGSRGLHCYDMDGKRLWSRDFGQMRIRMTFGEGSSPALCDDQIIVNWDTEDKSFIAAVDKKTGEIRWKKDRAEKTTWTTPIVVEQDGKKQIIVDGSAKIRAYDPATGDLIWECKGLTDGVIPSPVAGNGVVYCASGFRGNALLAIKLGGTGDISDSPFVAWRYGKSTPYVPSPLLAGERLYFLDNNKAVLSCFNAKDGNALFNATPISGLEGVYASPVSANGRVYLVGRNGATAVIKASDTLEILATNQLNDHIDASPALAGNELYLRGAGTLYCISEK